MSGVRLEPYFDNIRSVSVLVVITKPVATEFFKVWVGGPLDSRHCQDFYVEVTNFRVGEYGLQQTFANLQTARVWVDVESADADDVFGLTRATFLEPPSQIALVAAICIYGDVDIVVI